MVICNKFKLMGQKMANITHSCLTDCCQYFLYYLSNIYLLFYLNNDYGINLIAILDLEVHTQTFKTVFSFFLLLFFLCLYSIL